MTGSSSLQALVAAAEIQTAAEPENVAIANETPADATPSDENHTHLNVQGEEHYRAEEKEQPSSEIAQEHGVADPTAAPEIEANDVAAIQSTTANPIVQAGTDADAPALTENTIALDSVSQTANPIIGEDRVAVNTNNEVGTTTTLTANPIVPEEPMNPVVGEITTLSETGAPIMTANPVVTSIPVHVAPQETTMIHQQQTATNGLDFSMDVKMDESGAVPSLSVLNPTHEMPTDVDAAERAQQEAIAAAVVANNPPPALTPQDSTDALLPSSSSKSKPVRKRGWVKKTWEERLEELKAYRAVHGDCNVPTICKANPSLGHWVHDQRKQYRLYQNNKQTSMNPLRIAQLEDVGFKWALQRHTTMRSWAERFAQLEDFRKENGHCNVPIRYKTNPSLGQWVSTQRQEYSNYRNGKKSNMTPERISQLEAAEFCWSLRDTAKMAPRKSWDMHFAALKEFKKEHGHCDVRVRSKQNPTGSLGRWVEKQRSQYHSKNEGKDSKLTQDQIEKLDSIGFKWRIRHERNKISGCARNPDLKIDDEAMMDDYTRRAIDESVRHDQIQLSSHDLQIPQIGEMNQISQHQQLTEEEQQLHHAVHDTTQMHMQQVVHDTQMQEEQQMHQHAHHMDVQIEPEPMKVEDTLDGTVQVAMEPMSIETAAAVAAAEGIPIGAQPQPGTIPVHVPVSMAAPVPVAMPIHEAMDETVTTEV